MWKNGYENLKDLKACIKYSNNKQDVYKNIEEYNPCRKCNVLIVIADMIRWLVPMTYSNSNWTIYQNYSFYF